MKRPRKNGNALINSSCETEFVSKEKNEKIGKKITI